MVEKLEEDGQPRTLKKAIDSTYDLFKSIVTNKQEYGNALRRANDREKKQTHMDSGQNKHRITISHKTYLEIIRLKKINNFDSTGDVVDKLLK